MKILLSIRIVTNDGQIIEVGNAYRVEVTTDQLVCKEPPMWSQGEFSKSLDPVYSYKFINGEKKDDHVREDYRGDRRTN